MPLSVALNVAICFFRCASRDLVSWAAAGCVAKSAGCTNSLAMNFASRANVDDGSCAIGGCQVYIIY